MINPVLAAALEKLGEEAITAVTLLAKDLAEGKSVEQALTDLADTEAEEQARLFNAALDELDKIAP